ncbi:pilus assembly protein [uncultured Sphingomonas sp.]|mgnify:CR=1 FL=1|uniref:TadE/TadG family type IV pilus assembly protein n=1 Tax=uncultured Sphingomonas sp. TaxID=158754 RepID=UPI0025F720CB|nr:pilus assembly protein [uncultured Sphingomonas sp.]
MSCCVRLRALLRQLGRNEAGNALILTGALLIPLLALVGSSIDVGRYYVVRSRMQQACDASSLAGRWALSQGQSTTSASTEAVKFFNFNFKQGLYGTTPFTPSVSVTGTSTKVVAVTSTTKLGASVMGLFGFQPTTISTTCTAQQDFVNTDIVLVLDTTGSMADKASSSDNQTKIAALRSAVLALYDQLAPIQQQLSAAGMRLRFGVVPYSSTVNVGKLLYKVNADYIRNPVPYYRKVCNNNNCYAQQNSVSHKASSFADWSGCIEERQTVSTITASTQTIPSGAYDLDIDAPADSAEKRWPPYDPDAGSQTFTYGNNNTPTQTACPYEARRLQAWSRGDLNSYLNALAPDGGTYHDIGMIWGARLISPAGVFADSPASYNGMPTNRFIIFMTDGQLDTGSTIYSAYGIEAYDQRVTGGSLSTQDARHQQRFNLMCSTVKNRGVSVWVVAFASSLDTSLKNCATNPGQASTSGNSAALIAKFTEIGRNIGALRLTK